MSNKFKLILVFLSLVSIFAGVSLGSNKLLNFQSNVRKDNAQVISDSDEVTATISPIPSNTMAKEAKKITPTLAQKVRADKVNIGIVVDDYSNRTNKIPSLERELNIKFSTVSIYKQFGLASNSKLILEDLDYIKKSGKTLMIAWEPWNPNEGKSQSEDYLMEINNGLQDAYITEFAQNLKIYGNKAVIRFGHEMNGNWYPWAGRPEEYKKAYIRIVEIFRSNEVKNVSFNWSVNSENVPLSSFNEVSKYYPGTNYVDTIGIDGFNWGSVRPSGWTTFNGVFSIPYNYLSGKFQKPIIITEVSSTENGGDKGAWIAQMFSELNSNFSNVREIIWFNLAKESDWRIKSSDKSLTAFKNFSK